MKAFGALCIFIALIGLPGCSGGTDRSQGVYLLLDTSDTHAAEVKKAQDIIHFLLKNLQPGDTLIVSRIDSGRFSEKNIIAKARFDQRPSKANAQKRSFQKKITDFLGSVADSDFTDISGGILQAIESLNASGAGRKYILIFSDLEEELPKGFVRDVPLPLNGFQVLAFNVIKLRNNTYDPKNFLDRVEAWRRKTEKGGGQWRFIQDMERLDAILENSKGVEAEADGYRSKPKTLPSGNVFAIRTSMSVLAFTDASGIATGM